MAVYRYDSTIGRVVPMSSPQSNSSTSSTTTTSSTPRTTSSNFSPHIPTGPSPDFSPSAGPMTPYTPTGGGVPSGGGSSGGRVSGGSVGGTPSGGGSSGGTPSGGTPSGGVPTEPSPNFTPAFQTIAPPKPKPRVEGFSVSGAGSGIKSFTPSSTKIEDIDFVSKKTEDIYTDKEDTPIIELPRYSASGTAVVTIRTEGGGIQRIQTTEAEQKRYLDAIEEAKRTGGQVRGIGYVRGEPIGQRVTTSVTKYVTPSSEVKSAKDVSISGLGTQANIDAVKKKESRFITTTTTSKPIVAKTEWKGLSIQASPKSDLDFVYDPTSNISRREQERFYRESPIQRLIGLGVAQEQEVLEFREKYKDKPLGKETTFLDFGGKPVASIVLPTEAGKERFLLSVKQGLIEEGASNILLPGVIAQELTGGFGLSKTVGKAVSSDPVGVVSEVGSYIAREPVKFGAGLAAGAVVGSYVDTGLTTKIASKVSKSAKKVSSPVIEAGSTILKNVKSELVEGVSTNLRPYSGVVKGLVPVIPVSRADDFILKTKTVLAPVSREIKEQVFLVEQKLPSLKPDFLDVASMKAEKAVSYLDVVLEGASIRTSQKVDDLFSVPKKIKSIPSDIKLELETKKELKRITKSVVKGEYPYTASETVLRLAKNIGSESKDVVSDLRALKPTIRRSIKQKDFLEFSGGKFPEELVEPQLRFTPNIRERRPSTLLGAMDEPGGIQKQVFEFLENKPIYPSEFDAERALKSKARPEKLLSEPEKLLSDVDASRLLESSRSTVQLNLSDYLPAPQRRPMKNFFVDSPKPKVKKVKETLNIWPDEPVSDTVTKTVSKEHVFKTRADEFQAYAGSKRGVDYSVEYSYARPPSMDSVVSEVGVKGGVLDVVGLKNPRLSSSYLVRPKSLSFLKETNLVSELNKTIQKPKTMLVEKTEKLSLIKQPKLKQIDLVSFDTKTDYATSYDEVMGELTDTQYKPLTDTLFRTETITGTDSMTRTVTGEAEDTRTTDIITTTTIFEEPPINPIIEIEEAPPKKGKSRLRSNDVVLEKIGLQKDKAYDVFVKEKGRVRKLNEMPLPRFMALSRGATYVDDTPSASFEIRGSTKKLTHKIDSTPPSIMYKFTPAKTKKALRFVEKPKYRIDSVGEMAGITKKGLSALEEFRRFRF